MESQADEILFHQNHRLIDVLRYYKGIDKTTLAKQLKISMPTLYKILEDLKNNEIIEENGIQLNKKKSTFVGISIGSAQTKLIFSHTDFSIFSKTEFEYYKNEIESSLSNKEICVKKTESNNSIDFDYIYFQTPNTHNDIEKLNDFEKLKDALNIIFNCLVSFVEEGKLNIVGVGLSCTGIVNIKKQKIVQCHNLPYLDDTTLEGLIFPDIQEKFKRNGIDICLLQNSNAAVLAEKVFLYRNDSDYKYRKNVVAIYMGVGIGAGFLLDNSLFVGTTGFSGEIGHISAPELPKEYEEICKELHKKYTNRSIDKGCTCGKTDCYDFAIRTKVFLSSTKEMAEETSKSIESYLRENDGAQKILGFYLGNMVNMLTSMLNVDLIVFTGKIAQSMPLLFNHIAKIQDKNLLKFSRNDCAVIKSEYGALSPAIGSAIFSYYHKYSIDCEWN